MCGIVGFITSETKKGELDRSRFMRQALIIDTLRGADSTGAFSVLHKPDPDLTNPYWFKQLGGGEAFVNAKEYWENFHDVEQFRCVVGHNRAATLGAVNVDNAHPFIEGPITLVHNGTLTSTYGMPKSMYDCGVEVDSHAIAHNLATHDVEEVVAGLNGAFALVWHDARDDSINIVRNSRRPLHFGMGAGETLYFMSEGEMLAMLDSRLKLGVGNIYYPHEGQYMKWLPDTPVGRPITRELEMWDDHYWRATSSRYQTKYGGYGSHYGGYGTEYYGDEDEWEEDEPLPKAQAHPEKDDWILVGGRRKEVPMPIQEKLLSMDVIVEDRWEFTPTAYSMNPQDTNRLSVTGHIEDLGRGVIYSISPETANQTGTGSRWTVRIIGVKMDAKGDMWYICRLVSTFVNPAVIDNHVVRTTGIEDAEFEDAPGWDDIPFGMAVGSEGELISESQWFADVADGCIMCRKPIPLRDSPDVVWVEDGPICADCDDRLYVPLSKGESV